MKDLSQGEWKKKLEGNANAKVLDVRKPVEWAEGIIPDAITIDIMDIDKFTEEIKQLDKSKPYFIYCRSGARSYQACLILDQIGFDETYNLEGGILEWKGEVVEFE